jgi:2-polyprenyl-6-methoxyphenol hydroxylase-like FAD-dependent oxidoreductase
MTLRRGGVEETVRAKYLCGCDGARSVVRHGLQIDFPGGTYAQSFYVADVQGSGEYRPNALNVCLGSDGFGIVLPVRQSGSLRLIGIVPSGHETDDAITFDEIRDNVERHTNVKVSTLNWFSTYRVHHRVAD